MREYRELIDETRVNWPTGADFYHTNSEIRRDNACEFGETVAQFYADRAGEIPSTEPHYLHSEKVPLGPPKKRWWWRRQALSHLLFRRKSRRSFSSRQVTLGEISTLLQWSYGRREEDGQILSTAPSGGALYPIHLYLWCPQTELASGLYHYHCHHPHLDRLAIDLTSDQFDPLVINDNLEGPPALYVIMTADLSVSSEKYGDRAYRFALLEGGHIGQNLLLVAEYLGLSAVPLGGFYDRDLAAVMNLDYEVEKPIYLLAVGHSG